MIRLGESIIRWIWKDVTAHYRQGGDARIVDIQSSNEEWLIRACRGRKIAEASFRIDWRAASSNQQIIELLTERINSLASALFPPFSPKGWRLFSRRPRR